MRRHITGTSKQELQTSQKQGSIDAQNAGTHGEAMGNAKKPSKETLDVQSKNNNNDNNNQKNEKNNQKNKTSLLKNNPLNVNKLREFYEEELKRKDAIIDSLRNEREILIKTAIRQASNTANAQHDLHHLQGLQQAKHGGDRRNISENIKNKKA